MATEPRVDEPSGKFAAVLKNAHLHEEAPPRRRRRWVPRWLTMVLLLAAIGAGGYYISKRSGLLEPAARTRVLLTEKVRRADMLVSIAEDGNVESQHNVDIKCDVKNGSTILWIIKDGTQVKKGDELVRLDSANIEDQIMQQEIVAGKARAASIDSQEAYDAAMISVKEYEQGTYLKELQAAQAQVTVAKKNLESAKNSLDFTEKMLRRGYVNALQRDAAAFQVENSQLNLDMAMTTQQVLESFTREKVLVGLKATADSTKARHDSDQAALDLELSRLERLKTQLKNCTIRAPDNGMVIYANDNANRGGRGGQATPLIDEGAFIREKQTIIRLPDLSKMQVKATVHESKVDMLQRGMPAHVRIQDRDFPGKVVMIASQPEPTDIFSGNVKEYAATIAIEGDPTGLRPGMTAAVEILVRNLENVLTVPVESVVELGHKSYCWVEATDAQPRKQLLTLGFSNNTRIEVRDGLHEGDDVIKNPRAVVQEAQADVRDEDREDAKEKFLGPPASQAEAPRPAERVEPAG